MRELRLRMKFLTPAFLGGPDGSSAELRPPSVKGVLRFWWRATRAGNPDLRLKEAEIFGDTSGNGKASSFPFRSSFHIRPAEVGENDLKITRYKDTIIKGWLGEYYLSGEPELLQVALDAGLGAKNSQGYGCCALVT